MQIHLFILAEAIQIRHMPISTFFQTSLLVLNDVQHFQFKECPLKRTIKNTDTDYKKQWKAASKIDTLPCKLITWLLLFEDRCACECLCCVFEGAEGFGGDAELWRPAPVLVHGHGPVLLHRTQSGGPWGQLWWGGHRDEGAAEGYSRGHQSSRYCVIDAQMFSQIKACSKDQIYTKLNARPVPDQRRASGL